MLKYNLNISRLNSNTYQIEFAYPSTNLIAADSQIQPKISLLFQYIQTFFPSIACYILSDYPNKYSFLLNAESIQLFTKQLTKSTTTYKYNKIYHISTCLSLFSHLSQQINFFNKNKYSYLGFNSNTILCINQNIFINLDLLYLSPIVSDFILVDEPITQPSFSNPEIIHLPVLPTKIHKKCIYYSLGVLLIQYLLDQNLLVNNKIKEQQEIDQLLQPIKNSKIYWCIQRCLNLNVKDRLLLFI